MATQLHTPSPVIGRMDRARGALYSAAAFAGLIAVVYLLIGLQVLEVIEPSDDQPAFGFTAAAFFALLAVVLLAFRRRFVWVTAALIQVFVIFTYFNLASQRTPQYEVWGIALRLLQLPLIALLLYVIAKRTVADDRASTD